MLRKICLASLIVLALPLASTQAGVRIGVGIGVPFGGYYYGPGPYYGGYPYYGYGGYYPYYRPYGAVYVAPAPVYAQPAPVYAQPAPVYNQPAPPAAYAQRAGSDLLPAGPQPDVRTVCGASDLFAAVDSAAGTVAVSHLVTQADCRTRVRI